MRVKAPWKFQNQYNDIYWDVWTKLISCVGDLADVVEHCMEGVSQADGMKHLMETTFLLPCVCFSYIGQNDAGQVTSATGK